jgi:hypothetical protein
MELKKANLIFTPNFCPLLLSPCMCLLFINGLASDLFNCSFLIRSKIQGRAGFSGR